MNAPTGSLEGNPVGASTPTPRPKHTNLDHVQASKFLKLLNPKLADFTFQTFDDDRNRKNPTLTKIVQSQERGKLFQLHTQGAGVFVTINETDGRGRKSENIIRVRAVFQEDDDGFDGAFPLDPSIVVETSPNISIDIGW